MTLRRDDPIYYRNKLRFLLEKAQANGVVMEIENAIRMYEKRPIRYCFCDPDNNDRAGLALTEYSEEVYDFET